MQWPRRTPVPELKQDIVWNTHLLSCTWKPPRYGGRSDITFLKPNWSIAVHKFSLCFICMDQHDQWVSGQQCMEFRKAIIPGWKCHALMHKNEEKIDNWLFFWKWPENQNYTQPISMILVSLFSDDNFLSDEIKICYIFEYKSTCNENWAFRFLGTPGIAIKGMVYNVHAKRIIEELLKGIWISRHSCSLYTQISKFKMMITWWFWIKLNNKPSSTEKQIIWLCFYYIIFVYAGIFFMQVFLRRFVFTNENMAYIHIARNTLSKNYGH